MNKQFFVQFSRWPFLEKFLIWWGLIWGVLGLVLFFVGLAGFYYRLVVVIVFLAAIFLAAALAMKIKLWLSWRLFWENFCLALKKDKFLVIILSIWLIFLGWNFIATLAPELGFDALWYHLTLPKIWLMTHQIQYLPGGLLYYSVMPRLGELFFSVGLALETSGTSAKLLHWVFGVFWAVGIYIFLRQFLSRRISLLMTTAVYGTVWVSWLSQTAYIDLIVAFYVVLSLFYFFRYSADRDGLFLILAAVFMGFNLAAKTYGLLIFAVLTIMAILKFGWRDALKFGAIALLPALPFYLHAYLTTGNPLYPVFSVRDSALETYLGGADSLKDWYRHVWPQQLPVLAWRVLFWDFTAVLVGALLLPFCQNWRRMIWPLVMLLLFSLFWSLNPIQEQRYFLVALPILVLIWGFVVENIRWRFLCWGFIIVSLIFIGLNWWRVFQGEKKVLPVVFGRLSKMAYLAENLPLSLNFYDRTGGFGREIGEAKVLTVNIHNLFYLDFRFWDWSFFPGTDAWLKSASVLAEELRAEQFDYVLLHQLNLADWTRLPEADLARFFELKYGKDDYRLYRIK